MKQNEINKLGSWESAFFESGVLAVLACSLLWCIGGLITPMMGLAALYIILGSAVHITCYSLIGAPFFYFFWRRQNAVIWKWYTALPLGAFLGAIPFWVFALQAPTDSIGERFWYGVISAPYGVISALAALYIRWKRQHGFADAAIYLETEIDAPIERVFDLARSIDVHTAGASQTGERAIGKKTSGLVKWGDEITWDGRHFGLKQTLSSKVTHMKIPVHFEDQMTRGAFQSMRHRHRFVERGDRTVMIDEFLFKAPLGILGRLAEKLFLTAYMRRFLLRKNAKLKQIAESEDWRKFL